MKKTRKNKKKEETHHSNESLQLKPKLQEIHNKINEIVNYLKKEKMNGLADPKAVLVGSLEALAGEITVWMRVYNHKIDKNKEACLYLAPASYVDQMAYIYKTNSEPDVASKLSDQLKNDLSLLSKLFDGLYTKKELDKFNALNEAYFACLGIKK